MKLNPQLATAARKRLSDLISISDLQPIATIENPLINTLDGKTENIVLMPSDVISAYTSMREKYPDSKIVILNFASFKNPGGGFATNMMAQEEHICYCTNLYPELVLHSSWYRRHSSMLNSGAYANESMLHQGVTVLAWDYDMLMNCPEFTQTDVLTCAAPNFTHAYKSGNTKLAQQLTKVADDRIKYVCDIISTYAYDIAILGAFGCGVFHNDPEVVSTSFVRHLAHTRLNTAVFAIPDEKSNNYRTFHTILQKELNYSEIRAS